MTMFLLIAALMALITLALLTRPLWRRRGAAKPATNDQIVTQAREQLRQIEALRASGALGAEQAEQARAKVEQRIVAAVTQADPPKPAVAQRPGPLLPALSGFVLLVALAGYAWLGTPRALDPATREASADGGQTGHPITSEQIEAMVENLAARLKEQPNDAEGWAMLGRSYAVLGRHTEALPAFKQAMTLKSADPVLIADYADALAVTNGRNLEGEPLQLVERALAIDPNNLKALSLAGTAAFYRKDYSLALRHWEKMTQVDPNSEFVKQIQGGIEEARQLAAGGVATTNPTAESATGTSAKGGASVSGTVKLAASLANKPSPEDTVFVFARALDGPRMPLAILRKQVKDLPLKFVLDDSMAMSPAARLSSAQQVVIGARISKSGNAIAQPGDLQGQSAPVKPGANGLTIEISQAVGP